MVFTKEDIELVKKLIGIRDRGHYCNSQQLTDVYNRCLEKNVHNTSCGTCMRKRISELETALRQWEKKQEQITAKKAEEATEIAEQKKEEISDGSNGTPPKTTRRKKGEK